MAGRNNWCRMINEIGTIISRYSAGYPEKVYTQSLLEAKVSSLFSQCTVHKRSEKS